MSNVYGKYIPPAGGGTKYLKLKDGESAKIRIFSDEPLVRNTTNLQGKPQTKYTWIVYNHDLNGAQVMDQSVLVYKSIENMALSPWGDPTSYDVSIKRTGESTATRYFFTPMPNSQPLTAEQENSCKELDLKKEYPNGILVSEAYEGQAVPPPTEEKGENWAPTDEELNAVGF